jgi:hypothetical protein
MHLPNVPYFSDKQSYMSQLVYQNGAAPVGENAGDLRMHADNRFREWRAANRVHLPATATDILLAGGYAAGDTSMRPQNAHGPPVQLAADHLMNLATLARVVTSPKNIVEQMLFSNDAVLLPRELQLNQDMISMDEAKLIMKYFQKGKTATLKAYADEAASRPVPRGMFGESLFVRDAEYRSRFMGICKVNAAISKMNSSTVVNDMRKRMQDLLSTKRELLHFFQSVNGNAQIINPRFVM